MRSTVCTQWKWAFARLVGLQLADEMPDEAGHVRERCDLVASFLDVVLAEVDLSGRCGLADHRHRLQLADCQQTHRFGCATGRLGGPGDARTHRLQCRG
jgi:hypothetical protein